jgi:hypothetical protein
MQLVTTALSRTHDIRFVLETNYAVPAAGTAALVSSLEVLEDTCSYLN